MIDLDKELAELGDEALVSDKDTGLEGLDMESTLADLADSQTRDPFESEIRTGTPDIQDSDEALYEAPDEETDALEGYFDANEEEAETHRKYAENLEKNLNFRVYQMFDVRSFAQKERDAYDQEVTDALTELGLPALPDPIKEPEWLIGYLMGVPIAATVGSAIAAPATIPRTASGLAKGISIYIGLGKIESHIITKLKNFETIEGMEIERGLVDLLEPNSGDFTRFSVTLLDEAAKMFAAYGVEKMLHSAMAGPRARVKAYADKVKEKFFRELNIEYKLPQQYYIRGSELLAALGAPKESNLPPEVLATISRFLSMEELVVATKYGLDIEIPAHKLIHITDQPWWGKVKAKLRINPYEGTRIEGIEGKGDPKVKFLTDAPGIGEGLKEKVAVEGEKVEGKEGEPTADPATEVADAIEQQKLGEMFEEGQAPWDEHPADAARALSDASPVGKLEEFDAKKVETVTLQEAVQVGLMSVEEKAVIEGIMKSFPEAWQEHFSVEKSYQEFTPTAEQLKQHGIPKNQGQDMRVNGALFTEKVGALLEDARHIAVLFKEGNLGNFLHEYGHFIFRRVVKVNPRLNKIVNTAYEKYETKYKGKLKKTKEEWFSDEHRDWWFRGVRDQKELPIDKGLRNLFRKMLESAKDIWKSVRALGKKGPLDALFDDIILNGADLKEKFFFSDQEVLLKYFAGAEPTKTQIKAQGFSRNNKTWWSYDPGTICPKQLNFIEYCFKFVKDNNLPMEHLVSVEVLAGLYNEALAAGIDVPCSYCYVEKARRSAIALHQMGYSMKDVIAAKAKYAIHAVPYENWLLKATDQRIMEMNLRGGLRLFSFSDYIRELHYDQIKLLLSHAKQRGLSVKAITKNPHFVEDFADTGITINLSIDNVEAGGPAIDWKVAKRLKSKYPNVKVRSVALNFEEAVNYLNMMYEGKPFVDVVTPYHHDDISSPIPEGYEDMSGKSTGAKKLRAYLEENPKYKERVCCQQGGRCFNEKHQKQCGANCGLLSGNESVPASLGNARGADKPKSVEVIPENLLDVMGYTPESLMVNDEPILNTMDIDWDGFKQVVMHRAKQKHMDLRFEREIERHNKKVGEVKARVKKLRPYRQINEIISRGGMKQATPNEGGGLSEFLSEEWIQRLETKYPGITAKPGPKGIQGNLYDLAAKMGYESPEAMVEAFLDAQPFMDRVMIEAEAELYDDAYSGRVEKSRKLHDKHGDEYYNQTVGTKQWMIENYTDKYKSDLTTIDDVKKIVREEIEALLEQIYIGAIESIKPEVAEPMELYEGKPSPAGEVKQFTPEEIKAYEAEKGIPDWVGKPQKEAQPITAPEVSRPPTPGEDTGGFFGNDRNRFMKFILDANRRIAEEKSPERAVELARKLAKRHADRIADDVAADVGKRDKNGKPLKEGVVKAGVGKDEISARRAYSQGRKDMAAEMKARQLEKIEIARQEQRKKREVTKKWKQMVKASKAKNIDSFYQDQIVDIVKAIDPKGRISRTQKKIESTLDFIEREKANGEMLEALAPKWLERVKSTPITEFTLEEIRALHEQVMILKKLGSLKKKLINSQARREFEAQLKACLEIAEETWGKVEAKPKLEQALEKAPKERQPSWKDQYLAKLKRPEFTFRHLDGWAENGPNQEIMRWADHAFEQEVVLGHEVRTAIYDAFEGLDSKWASQKASIEGWPEHIRQPTNSQKLSMALNTFNKGNREAMKAGYDLTDAHLDAIQRSLSPVELQAVKDILNVYEKILGPRLAKKYKQLYGTDLKMEKDYFPLFFDSTLNNRAANMADAAAADSMFHSSLFHPKKLADGFLNERVGGKLPPIIDLGVIMKSTADVVHWLTHVDFIRDARKIIWHEDYKNMVSDVLSPAHYNELKGWVNHIAKPEYSRDVFEKGLDYFRRNTTIFALGYKVTVSAKQMLSILNTADEIGIWNTVKGTAEFLANPRKAMEYVDSLSPTIRDRVGAGDREIMDTLGKALEPYRGQWKGMIDTYKQFAMYMIRGMDAMTVYASHLSAMKEGFRKGMTESEAAEFATSVINRTQPTSNPKDLAPIQRGGAISKALSMFYSYLSILHNRLGERMWQYYAKKIGIGKLASSVMLMLMAQSMMAKQIDVGMRERRMITPMEGLTSALSLGIAGLPGFRDIGNYAINKAKGEWSNYVVSPAVEGIERMITSAPRAWEHFTSGDVWDGMYDAIDVLGYSLGLPGAQMKDTMRGIEQFQKTGDPTRMIVPSRAKRGKLKRSH